MIAEHKSGNGGNPGNGHGALGAKAIEVDHIFKKYGDFTAVDGISFSVADGEIFGLLGPNGAGKSTLIRMMTTLIPITAGHSLIAGHDVAKEPAPVSRVAVWEMLTNIKSHRQLTILLTTHYMDEADRLCERIAIVDHGKLVALDTPLALKASVPGSTVIEVQFENPPADWEQRLHGLGGVTSVQSEGAAMYRVLTSDGTRTTTELVEMAVHSGVRIRTLSVQNTTLDDVFVHYTGRQLRDELVKPLGFVMPPRPGMQP